jgi:hypothetical protein
VYQQASQQPHDKVVGAVDEVFSWEGQLNRHAAVVSRDAPLVIFDWNLASWVGTKKDVRYVWSPQKFSPLMYRQCACANQPP